MTQVEVSSVKVSSVRKLFNQWSIAYLSYHLLVTLDIDPIKFVSWDL